jgi:F-box protein 18 (helicase)
MSTITRSTSSNQQHTTTTTTILSDEQTEIINSDCIVGQNLRILAFAGTGKTKTLLEYTNARVTTRFLYLAFNRSVATEAVEKFGRHVECRTLHSLAFGAIGWQYTRVKDKFAENGFDYLNIAKVLRITPHGVGLIFVKLIVTTVLNYLQSTDESLLDCHMSHEFVDACVSAGMAKHILKIDCVRHAKEIVKRMNDVNDTSVPMIHDGYLKLYQLSYPDWSQKWNCILIDEAQDTSGPGVALANMQKNVSLILCGDPHQQIYAFRGALNAMDRMTVEKTMYLSNSFRFGQQISQIVNSLLWNKKKEAKKVVGTKSGDSVLTQLPSHIDKFVFIARKNVSLFDKAFSVMKRKKVAFLSGIRSYNTIGLWNMYYLSRNNIDRVHDAFLASFGSFARFTKYIKDTKDPEYKNAYDLVCKYWKEFPNLLKSLITNAEANEANEDYDVLFSTVHKAKGMEWDNVVLASDFFEEEDEQAANEEDDDDVMIAVKPEVKSEVKSEGGGTVQVKSEEQLRKEEKNTEETNVLYVALTRAKKILVVPECVQDICYGRRNNNNSNNRINR